MRKCMLTGKKPLVGHKVSHSNIKTKMRQLPNLQAKRIWDPVNKRWIKLRLSTRAIRTIDKIGLEAFWRQFGGLE